MNWTEIESLARLKLRDPNGVIWSSGDLLSYANRTIEETVRESEGHIKHIIFPLTSGTRRYDFPDDFFELRGVSINGKKIFGKKPFELEDLDQAYLTATGTPEFYYQEDSKTISFYKVPSWTSSYTEFSEDLGVLVDWANDDTHFDATSEFGLAIDIASDSETYVIDSILGEVIAADEGMLVCKISYVYQPEYLVNGDDVPDFSDPYQYIVLYGTLEKALKQEGQGKNSRLSSRYGMRRMELSTEFLARQKEYAHGKDQITGMVQMTYGAEKDYSMRIWR